MRKCFLWSIWSPREQHHPSSLPLSMGDTGAESEDCSEDSHPWCVFNKSSRNSERTVGVWGWECTLYIPFWNDLLFPLPVEFVFILFFLRTFYFKKKHLHKYSVVSKVFILQTFLKAGFWLFYSLSKFLTWGEIIFTGWDMPKTTGKDSWLVKHKIGV